MSIFTGDMRTETWAMMNIATAASFAVIAYEMFGWGRVVKERLPDLTKLIDTYVVVFGLLAIGRVTAIFGATPPPWMYLVLNTGPLLMVLGSLAAGLAMNRSKFNAFFQTRVK